MTLNQENNIYFVKLSDGKGVAKYAYNIIVVFFYCFLVFPHLLTFLLHPRKTEIRSDIGTLKNMLLSLIFLKHYRNLFYYRIGNIKYLFKWLLPEDHTIHVPASLRLGINAHFVHNISTFLNAKKVGDHFICYHHVTLGSDRLSSDKLPVVGNHVTIYTGAVVVGDVIIGDHVKIGANAVVVKSIPSNCTVVGSPARIIKQDGKKVDILL